MTFRALLARHLAGPASPAPLSPDLRGDDPERLRADMRSVANDADRIRAGRRAEALADLHRRLTPEGRARFAAVAGTLDAPVESGADRYARMEEMEYFGRVGDRLALLDGFVPPRRRLLTLLAAAAGGRETLEAIRRDADGEFADEIDRALGTRC